MKSTKCAACGFVGWSDVEHCKSCGAPLNQASTNLPPAAPVYGTNYDSWNQSEEGQKNGLAIAALVLGIISFLTFGILGIGAITGIILAAVAMGRAKREPWKYGGRGMAIAGLVLCATSLVMVVPIGIVASIAIPNLLAARQAANEGSAMRSLREIAAAEGIYQSTNQKFGTLEELAASNLIDAKLAKGSKNGYEFSVVVDSSNPEAFEVYCVPSEYRSTGRRSFYVDETFVLRGGDNSGGPSSKQDEPLETDSNYPNRSNRRIDYRGNTDF
jgi:type IV pilus assembly protein PilA